MAIGCAHKDPFNYVSMKYCTNFKASEDQICDVRCVSMLDGVSDVPAICLVLTSARSDPQRFSISSIVLHTLTKHRQAC